MKNKEYVIYGKALGIPREEIDTAKDKKELNYLLGEYQMAYGPGWSFTHKQRYIKR